MKHAKWVVAVAFLVLSSMAVAQKIGSLRIVPDVPFEFMVANKVVPAGQYVVQAATMDGQNLFIRNAGAKVGLVSSTNTSERSCEPLTMRWSSPVTETGTSYQGSNWRQEYQLPSAG